MKKRLLIFPVCFLAMALLPLLSAKDGEVFSKAPDLLPNETVSAADSSVMPQEKNGSSPKSDEYPSAAESKENTEEKTEEKSFIILDSSSGRTVTVNDKDFCIGALAYEMAPSFEIEALKAQTVALYTHFCRLRDRERADPDKELKGADFSADLSKGEFYLSEEQLKEKWGSVYDESIEKVRSAVGEVFGEVLKDENGELIDAAYHAISSGATENSEDIFGFESPYLQAVASPGDTKAPGYLSEAVFDESEFKQKLKALDEKADTSKNGAELIGEIKKTPSGSVTEIELGGIRFSGSDVRKAFGLRSAAFEMKYDGGSYIFTVRGYGHGVGLSQYGAQSMALEGFDYREILNWYYSSPVISK